MKYTLTPPPALYFFELAQQQPDLEDFMVYLKPTLRRMDFVNQKMEGLTPEIANTAENLAIQKTIHQLVQVELKAIIEEYCRLGLKWRTTAIVEKEQNYTSKDIVLERFKKIATLVQEAYEKFQVLNRSALRKQSRYILEDKIKSSVEALDPTHFINKFNYKNYQAHESETVPARLYPHIINYRLQRNIGTPDIDKTNKLSHLLVAQSKMDNIFTIILLFSFITIFILSIAILYTEPWNKIDSDYINNTVEKAVPPTEQVWHENNFISEYRALGKKILQK